MKTILFPTAKFVRLGPACHYRVLGRWAIEHLRLYFSTMERTIYVSRRPGRTRARKGLNRVILQPEGVIAELNEC